MSMSLSRVGVTAILFSILMTFAALGAQGGNQVPYPDGYREWMHVKSMVIEKGHPLFDAFGGMHHIYANPAAADALRASKSFPDGAVFVFDLLTATMEKNAVVEGPRKVLGVMHRDAARFKETGGWGFEGFKGDTRDRVVKDPAKECFACHRADQPQDFVFSTWRK